MGSGSSCYPSRDQQGSMASEPYDTRRLLSDLITVQTAIVLSDDIAERRGDYKAGHHGDHRTSIIEYTITTSLTVPVPTVSIACPAAGKGGVLNPAAGSMNHDLPFTGLELPGGGLVDVMTTHFKHKVDVVTRATSQGLMTTIHEVAEASCS